jgi:hypothetical protein
MYGMVAAVGRVAVAVPAGELFTPGGGSVVSRASCSRVILDIAVAIEVGTLAIVVKHVSGAIVSSTCQEWI